MTRLRLAATALATSLVLVGCGGGGDTDSPAATDATSEAPAGASGDEVKTESFTFSLPEGWKSNDEAAPQALMFASDSEDTDGFADNVNVISEPKISQVDGVEALGKSAADGLKSAKASDVEVGDPTQLDGEDAAVVTSLFSLNGQKYRTLQYVVAHEDDGFVVTFSFSEDLPAADQEKIAESVGATWKWAS